MSVPEKASCYKKALEQASEYYQQYLNAGCQEIIRKAKVHCAGQQYSQALEELASPDIVWTTECAKEENKLIAQIAAQVSKQEIEKYEREKEERKIQREEYRFNAMMQLTDEYFSRLAAINE
jgi:hypothetical protein